MIQISETEYERVRAIVAAAEAWASQLTSRDRAFYEDDVAVSQYPSKAPLAAVYCAVSNGKGSAQS